MVSVFAWVRPFTIAFDDFLAEFSTLKGVFKKEMTVLLIKQGKFTRFSTKNTQKFSKNHPIYPIGKPTTILHSKFLLLNSDFPNPQNPHLLIDSYTHFLIHCSKIARFSYKIDSIFAQNSIFLKKNLSLFLKTSYVPRVTGNGPIFRIKCASIFNYRGRLFLPAP
jgi:hypothetical protein